MRAANGEPVSFLGGEVPPGFELRHVVVEPRGDRPGHDGEWTDALVVVESGEIEVEAIHGGRATFVAGDVLCLQPTPPRLIRNRGSTPAVLSVVRRRCGRPLIPRPRGK